MKNFLAIILVLSGLYLLTAFISTSVDETGRLAALKTKPGEKKPPAKSKKHYRFRPNNCTSCHTKIEPIRNLESGMMQAILELADKAGATGNDCIVCHGGNPMGTRKETSHVGAAVYFETHSGPKNFYPDPGSPWINQNTCGTCHKEQVKTQYTSLMFTEAGKIQGSLWGFGGLNGYEHNIGNYDVEALDVHEQLGTETYKTYMAELIALEPQLFPSKMSQLPPAPTADEVQDDPQLAVYTYLRQECQRCHTGNKGRQARGDYRGMGCSSCHIPYSNEGVYEGVDPMIKGPGKLLVHNLQATREAKVTVHNHRYSGIPVETCTTCHDRGKRIGTSYQGLMETAYSSPFMGDGEKQEGLHTKNYLHLHADIHLDKGMLCQDCHTSGDVHSTGFLAGSTLAPVEIECQDCHGTPGSFPWDLPIGYGDEVGGLKNLREAKRGVALALAEHMKNGTVYDREDGYLISARGNPLPDVTRRGDLVIVHTAGGKDLELKPLKTIYDNGELSLEGEVAMVTVEKHVEELECYTCHATWAPQCYGCHIKIDYSKPCKKKPDWVAIGQDHDQHGLTADARNELEKFLIDGEVTEERSYLRWENPPLVRNGENRVSPAIPGCQTTITVIGQNGETLLLNQIFRIPNVEGAGDEGQLGIDISPTQPHTVQKQARHCESCHTNPQSMGYGIEGGKIYEDPSKEYVVELSDAYGNVMPDSFQVQINAIPNLDMDWSRFVTEEGEQKQTVGHHYKNSRPLNNEERAKLDRRGVCLSCHQSIPKGDMAISLLAHVKEMAGKKIDTEAHGGILHKSVLISAWAQVLLVFFLLFLGIFAVVYWVKKRKQKF